ncbi:MAG: hypothetical protein KGP12_11445 [Actinomycetales bacterium]|nr:hypothetical protein [Actinomycetales bacterium]
MTSMLLYEWRRVTTIRATYVLSTLSLLSAAGVAWLRLQVGEQGGVIIGGIPIDNPLVAGANPLSATFAATIAAAAFGHEYRYRLVGVTLGEFPRRAVVYVGKGLMMLLWIAMLYAASVALAWVIVISAGGTIGGPDSALVGQLIRSGSFLAGYCGVAFAITALTRSLILGVVTPLAVTIFEVVAWSLLEEPAPWLTPYLPMAAANRFLSGEADPTQAPGWSVLLGWTALITTVSYLSFRFRDA